MTTAQKKDVLSVLLAIAGPVLAIVFASGVARQQLAAMEPASAHELDIARVNARMDLQFVRDSAARAEMRLMLKDVACERHPAREYCR